MDYAELLAHLKRERDNIVNAIEALRELAELRAQSAQEPDDEGASAKAQAEKAAKKKV